MPFGGAIKLTGESEYVRALTQINGKLKETTADMKLVSASFSSNDKSVQATAQKTEVLTRKLNEQKEKLSLLKSEYAKMQGTYSEQKSKHEQLVQEYQKEEKELERIAKESGTTSKAYQDQKKKVDALAKDVEKSTKADIANEKAMSKMRAEITKTEAEVKKTTRQIDDLGKETKQTASETKDAGDGFTVFKGILSNLATDALRRVIEGLKQLAKAAIEAWKEFDKGADIIIAKTGDTGQGIMDVYGKVAGQVPAELEEIGSAVGQVSTRFDLQGEALEDVTTQFLKFAKVNSTDVEGSIDSVQSMMAAWNIRTKDTTRVLSVLTSASQKTGINVDTLSDLMVTNAASIQELGLGYEDAAFFVGEFSKSGLDTSQTMMGLKKALQAATKEGKPLNQFLAEAEKNIKGAKTEQEALTIATSTFGTKAGPNLAKALRNGNISFKDFEKGVKASDKALDDTFNAMMSFPDRVKMMSNSVKTLFGSMFQSITNNDLAQFVEYDLPAKMDEIIPQVNTLIEDICEGFTNNYKSIGDALTTMLNKGLGEVDTKPIGKALAELVTSSSYDVGKNLDVKKIASNIFGGLWEGMKEYAETDLGKSEIMDMFKDKLFDLFDNQLFSLPVHIGELLLDLEGDDFWQPYVDEWLGGLGLDVERTLTKYDIATAVMNWLLSPFQGAIEAVKGFINQEEENLIAELDIWGQIFSGKIGELINSVIEQMLLYVAEFLGLGEEDAQAFVDGIMGKKGDAEKAGKEVSDESGKGLGKGKKGAKKQGSDTSANYASGVSSGKGKAGSVGSSLGSAVISALNPFSSMALSVGTNLVSGLWEGISGNLSWIKEKISGWVGDVNSFLKNLFGIKSPSKVYAKEIGAPLAQGIGVGFEYEMKDVAAQMGESIPTSFNVSTSTRSTSRQAREQANMVTAFKQALSDVKIVLNNKVAGQFVETTVSRLIYS